MLEKLAKEVGEGTETEAEMTLNMLAMTGEEKGREGSGESDGGLPTCRQAYLD